MIAPDVRFQKGTALVVSLVMLTLITLLVITALNLGMANFRSVSNTQYRDEAISAANFAINQIVSSNFTDAGEQDLEVDLDTDGDPDYVVNIAQPQCIYAAVAASADPSSVGLPASMTMSSTWNTVWDLDATVLPSDTVAVTNTGQAAVRVRSGVRVIMNEAEKNLRCPD